MTARARRPRARRTRYTAAGTYTVSLTATNASGSDPEVKSNYITVAPAPTPTPTPTPTRDAEPTPTPLATPTPTPGAITLSVRGYKVKGVRTADLTWSGASSSNVDVRRNGSVVATTLNDGLYTDSIPGKGAGTFLYKVCAAGSTTTCSPEVSVSY